jgi:protein-S-isoprenylcysteine O-methyltransferase Ste14
LSLSGLRYASHVRPYLEDLALLICAVYATIPAFWLTLHPFANHWRTRGRNAFKTILPLWLLYIAIAALALSRWRHAHLYASNFALIPGAVLILTGLLLYRSSSRNFTHVQLSGLAEVEPDRHTQQLITTGIRARVRHPIYLGHLCELLGWTIALGTASLFALSLFAMLTGAVMLHLEDNELESRFGESYRTYRHTVPAIFPRLF